MKGEKKKKNSIQASNIWVQEGQELSGTSSLAINRYYYEQIFLAGYKKLRTSSRMNSSTGSQSWILAQPRAGSATLTAALSLVEWITLIISPEWIFPKEERYMTIIRL